MRLSRIAALGFLLVASFSFAQSNQVRLVLWGGVPPEAGPQKMVDNFNAEFAAKGISLEYERFVNDDTGNLKLETNLLGGSAIDLYMTYSVENLIKRANSNMALDLSSLTSRDKFDIAQNFGSLAKNYFVNGKPYCLPTKIDQNGILVNRDMFVAAGIPIPKAWTFEEFRAVAKKLTKGTGESKVYGMFFNTQQEVTYPYQYFAASKLGGDVYYMAGAKKTNLADPVMVKSLKLFADMTLTDMSAPSHADTISQKLTQEGMFLSGRSAMTIGSWIVRSVKDTAKFPHDFMTAVVPYPTVDKTAKYTVGGLGDYLVINPKSKNIEAAWAFAKWYAASGMLPLAAGGRIPSYVQFDKTAVVDAFLTGAEKILDKESVKAVIIDPKSAYAAPTISVKLPEIRKVVIEATEAVLLGKSSPEAALAAARLKADDFLK